MLLQSLVCKYAGGADLRQIAGELALQHPIPASAKEDNVAHEKSIQVAFSHVIAVIPYAPVALDAAIHLVVYKGPEILIAKRALLKFIPPVHVPRHDGHVLKMAFTAFIAHRAIMGVIQHQPFNHAGAEGYRVLILNRKARSFGRRPEAGHHQLAAFVSRSHEQLYGTLPACPN